MKQALCFFMIISLTLCMLGCSKSKAASVLDDISRDTYENNLRMQREENIGKPKYEEPPTYEQYLRERKGLIPEKSSNPPER